MIFVILVLFLRRMATNEVLFRSKNIWERVNDICNFSAILTENGY